MVEAVLGAAVSFGTAGADVVNSGVFVFFGVLACLCMSSVCSEINQKLSIVSNGFLNWQLACLASSSSIEVSGVENCVLCEGQ